VTQSVASTARACLWHRRSSPPSPLRVRGARLGLLRREGWHGGAAPRSVARQTLPPHRSASPVFTTSYSGRATMHGAAHAFHRAIAIYAAKSVNFEKKKTVLNLKFVYKNVKNNKKIAVEAGGVPDRCFPFQT